MNNQSAAFSASRFRFRGHHQSGAFREFHFEDVQEQAPVHRFLVRVDTGLLIKHQIHLQDAPRLCIQLLSGLKLASSVSADSELSIIFSDDALTSLIEQAESASAAGKHKKKGR